MCAKKATSAPKKPAVKPNGNKSADKTSENGVAPSPSPAKLAANTSLAKTPMAKTASKAVTKSLSTKTVPLAAAAKASASRGLSDHDIGEIAGEVWGYLSSGEPQTLAAIKKAVNAPADLVIAAIGWLAREHKLDFVASGKTQKLTLK